MKPIYLDNHSTTRTDPRVVEAMLPYFDEAYGNPSSRSHAYGWETEEAVERARGQVAELLGSSSKELLFTSGATESNNLALKGVAEFHTQPKRHIVTTQAEHKSILDICAALQRHGVEVTFLPVDEFGQVSPQSIEAALQPETILVSVLMANNEIGTLNPIATIGQLCKQRQVLFHVDAAQAFGKLPLDVEALGVDLLSLSGHKIYGPKGVGALYVRRRNPRVRLAPILDGGGQERGMRSGTLNVPGIVGLGIASAICGKEMPEERERTRHLRDRLEQGLRSRVEGILLNGHPVQRLEGNLNVSFEGIDGTALLTRLRGLAVSSGSACNSATLSPSHVLRAIGRSDLQAQATLRFGIGRFNTESDIDTALEQLVDVVLHLRQTAPAPTIFEDDEESSHVRIHERD